MNLNCNITIAIDDRIIAFARRALTRRNAVIALAAAFIAASALLYAAANAPHVFSPGDTISSSQVNENFETVFGEINRIDGELVLRPPVGSIIAWHKSMFNTPELPDGWVECNGQVLIDGDSVYTV